MLAFVDDAAAAARELLAASPDESKTVMEALEKKRTELHAARAQLRKDIRRENKKRKRLVSKAKGLSEDDLMNVLVMKAQAKAKAESKA